MQENDFVESLEKILEEDAMRLTEGSGTWADLKGLSFPDLTPVRPSGKQVETEGTVSAAGAILEVLAAPPSPTVFAKAAANENPAWWRTMTSPVLSVLSLLPGIGQESSLGEVDLPLFEMPEDRRYNLGFDRSSPAPFEVDRNAEGAPRRAGQGVREAETNISIEVTAMDSQSFLDRRYEIADAVRMALLESHRLRDTLSGEE